MKNGWHNVNTRTRLLVEDGKPTKVETTSFDLDAAIDRAGHYCATPLDRTSPWRTDDGRALDDVAVEKDAKVTCGVEAQS